MYNVAIIIERAQIGLGGAERSVSELTTELRKQGVNATILAAKGDTAENTQILCDNISGKRVSLDTFEQALRQHLKEHAYDIIHSTLPLKIAHIYQPRGGSYREAMLQNIASYPCALKRCFKRSTHFLNLRRTAYLRAEKTLCRNSTATVAALSDYVKQQFQKHYALPERRLAVIANGINVKMTVNESNAAAIRETIHTTLSIPPGKKCVFFLFAANNPRLKGLRSLLFALKQVTGQGSVHPVVLIAGTKGLGRYQQQVQRLELDNHLVSLGPLDGIADALSICDVAVLPTYYDPCSRFILEALAMGKPVITTRFNGASERFTHQRHGIIIDTPSDHQSLADGMAHFCRDEEIELASQAIVDDNLCDTVSIARHAEAMAALYETILKSGKNSR